jgi:hypothetical protein
VSGDLGERATEAWGQFIAWARDQLSGTPLGAVLIAVVILLAVWSFHTPAPRTCGTCGANLRREHHKPWCKGGRWGGQQRWRDDA